MSYIKIRINEELLWSIVDVNNNRITVEEFFMNRFRPPIAITVSDNYLYIYANRNEFTKVLNKIFKTCFPLRLVVFKDKKLIRGGGKTYNFTGNYYYTDNIECLVEIRDLTMGEEELYIYLNELEDDDSEFELDYEE